MNYKLRGEVVFQDRIEQLEFENIEQYILEAKEINYLLDERVELYYNDIPLDTTDIVDSEENIELILEQVKEIDEDYEEEI